MDVPKTVFFLLIALIPMTVELRVPGDQKGNKQHKIMINKLSYWTWRQLQQKVPDRTLIKLY